MRSLISTSFVVLLASPAERVAAEFAGVPFSGCMPPSYAVATELILSMAGVCVDGPSGVADSVMLVVLKLNEDKVKDLKYLYFYDHARVQPRKHVPRDHAAAFLSDAPGIYLLSEEPSFSTLNISRQSWFKI